ncbi:MAG TPA: T9SS type A sorting domain-containing protein [Chitinophagales bacterium]|nr:T9SS type A sorting domain-containing protein [Chitinophagales bacterium]
MKTKLFLAPIIFVVLVILSCGKKDDTNPMKLFKAILMWVGMLLSLPSILCAQAPEQDCSGAIVETAALDTFPVYSTAGQNQELIFEQNTTCLIGGEENSVWITFTACTAGYLVFEIKPSGAGDDFDWTLYDFTNHTCADVLDTVNQLRCNYSAVPGWTGLDTQYNMISVPSGGPNQCKELNPYPGQRFLLMVNNHANSNTGFILAFGGTATLCNTVGIPKITNNKFSLYPNPTDGSLRFKNLPSKNNLTIEVMNVYGMNVLKKEIKTSDGKQLDLPAALPNGFYVLNILGEGKVLDKESFIIAR